MEDSQIRIEYDKLDCLEDYRVTYNGELFTGIAFEENEYGLDEESFVDGVREGLSREYYLSGQLRFETHLHRGGVEGLWRRWYEGGQLEVEKVYDEHSVLIKERIWNRKGDLVRDWSK